MTSQPYNVFASGYFPPTALGPVSAGPSAPPALRALPGPVSAANSLVSTAPPASSTILVLPALPAPPTFPTPPIVQAPPAAATDPVSAFRLSKRASDKLRRDKVNHRKTFIRFMWINLSYHIKNNVFLLNGVNGTNITNDATIQAFVNSIILQYGGRGAAATDTKFQLPSRNVINAQSCVNALIAGAIPAMNNTISNCGIHIDHAFNTYLEGLLAQWVRARAQEHNAI